MVVPAAPRYFFQTIRPNWTWSKTGCPGKAKEGTTRFATVRLRGRQLDYRWRMPEEGAGVQRKEFIGWMRGGNDWGGLEKGKGKLENGKRRWKRGFQRRVSRGAAEGAENLGRSRERDRERRALADSLLLACKMQALPSRPEGTIYRVRAGAEGDSETQEHRKECVCQAR